MPKPAPHNIDWNGEIQDMKKTMVKRGSSIVTHTGFGYYLSIHNGTLQSLRIGCWGSFGDQSANWVKFLSIWGI